MTNGKKELTVGDVIQNAIEEGAPLDPRMSTTHLKSDIEQLISQARKPERAKVIEEIEKEMDRLEFCKCDPLSSGEEFCNDGCSLRAKLNSMKGEG